MDPMDIPELAENELPQNFAEVEPVKTKESGARWVAILPGSARYVFPSEDSARTFAAEHKGAEVFEERRVEGKRGPVWVQ